jgi:hypothetical protein
VGGSGSGSYGVPREAAAARRREAEEASRAAQLEAEVNSLLNHRLIEVNRRNNEEVNERLEEVQAALADHIDGIDRLLFGGSVSKETYVEGLSDIDALLVLDAASYGDLSAEQVQERLARGLESGLDMGKVVAIRPGDLAVTVYYKDDLQLQLLPAVERDRQLSIKALGANRWVAIEPRKFAEALTAANKAQAGAVVPAVKLAKSILASAPDSGRPSGYHLEALAIAAFKEYTGPRNPKAMLTRLFESAAQDVKRPIADLSGQSRHVDEYLGAADSKERRAMSRELTRYAHQMRNAPSADAWRALLGDN